MRSICVVLLCLFSASPLLAQPGGSNAGFDGSTSVTKKFKPTLIPATKLLIDPVIPEATATTINVTYSPYSYQWNTRKITKILPPAGHYEPGLDTSYNPNYVRLGAGSYAHKLGELYLANRANKTWAYNFTVQHLSADQKNSLRDFSTTRAFLGGARFFNRSSLELRVNYLRDMNKFFALDSNYEKPGIRNLKKVGQNMGFNMMYDLVALENKPGFKFGFMFNNFYNNLSQSETEFGARTGWDVNFKNIKTYGDISGSSLQYRQSFISTQQYFLDVKPRVKFTVKEKGVDAIAGVNLTVNWLDKNKPKVYPNLYLYGEKKLEGLKMKFYGGLDGGLMVNSIRRFSEYVPFTYDTIKVINSFESLKLFAGIKGRITENSQFSFEVGNRTISDMPLVVKSNDSIGGLQLVYDGMNWLYFAGDVRFSIGEKLRIGANGRLNQFTPDNVGHAWHLPAANYGVNIQYLLRHQWVFQLGADGMGKRYSSSIVNTATQEMKGFTDLNLRVDYVLKNVIRFWVQGSNLLNQKYQVWYGYRSYGLSVLGGISASF